MTLTTCTGIVVLVGLAAKNAILIVEFARDRQQEGAPRFDAAMEAARMRLRPSIMTSFAFILGVSCRARSWFPWIDRYATSADAARCKHVVGLRAALDHLPKAA